MRTVPVLTVVLSSENFWCNVVGSSTEGTGGVTGSDPLLNSEGVREEEEEEEELQP